MNELTLGIERLTGAGDVDGVNLLRNALAAQLGSKLQPIDVLDAAAKGAVATDPTTAVKVAT